MRDKVKTKFSIKTHLTLLAIIPMITVVIPAIIIAINAMKTGMRQEAKDALHEAAQGVMAGFDMSAEGDYSLDKDGKLYKGSVNLSNKISQIDEYVAGTDFQVTIFYGDVRKLTTLKDNKTGDRIVETKASEEVAKKVIKEGKEYFSTDLVINNEPYYAYYLPIYNSDSSEVVGMAFAGKPVADMNAFINSKIRFILICVAVIVVVSFVISLSAGRKIAKDIVEAESVVSEISQGNLTVAPSEKLQNRGDEIGDIACSIETLRNELSDVIQNIQEASYLLAETGKNLDEMADQTNTTSTDISTAVEGISMGAVTQAEEVETATGHVSDIGNDIEDIMNTVRALYSVADDMASAGDVSARNIKQLQEAGEQTLEAIASIEKQVIATNQAVESIKGAVNVINDIASQTSLLSLNASIEAARAGEMGKGFAVVANEISSLAAQSAESSKQIEQTVIELASESEKSVDSMVKVKGIMEIQEQKLNDTTTQFISVSNGIASARRETEQVKVKAEKCDKAKNQIQEVMTNLSAVSQENAASTEETTASMEELNANINVLAEEARKVSEMSENLKEKISIFTV